MASGGLVSKAERTTLEATSTTGQLGPGGYEMSPTKAAAPAPVPFHASSQKVLMENRTTSAVTPGPGAYEASHSKDVLQTMHIAPVGYTAPFASHTKRLAEDKTTRVGVPGPGSYHEGNVWIKKSGYKAESKQRIIFDRASTAPSIPANHQSYGYEEGDNGLLVMQKPPEPVFSGVGRDSVGPGRYELSEPTPSSPKAVAWGKDGAKRSTFHNSGTPGPGTYQLTKSLAPPSFSSPVSVTINGVEVKFGGAAGTAQFMSKTPLVSQRVPGEHEMTPGPGQYLSRPDLSVGQRAKTAAASFGSLARRSFEIDPVSSTHSPSFFRAPGPGSYEASRGLGTSGPLYSEPLPFSSTSQRFQAHDNGNPGPGAFRTEVAYSVARDQEIKAAAAGRNGAFGSTIGADRFKADNKQANLSPSPGSYDVAKQPSPPRHRGDSSVFQSKTHRFRATTAPPTILVRPQSTSFGTLDAEGSKAVRGDASCLGPGSYLGTDSWNKASRHPGYKKSAFGSDSSRISTVNKAAALIPGPGRYALDTSVDKVFQPVTNSPKEAGFGGSSQRFHRPSPSSLGPGTHEIGVSTLNKKSFNLNFQG